MSTRLAKRFVAALVALALLLTTVRCYNAANPDSHPAQESHHERSQQERSPRDVFCAVTNPTSGSYIDLSQLSSTPNRSGDDNGGDEKKNHDAKTRWLVRGWGYGANFTLGICSSPVIMQQEQTQLPNTTGAFYTDESEQPISIGDFSTTPLLLGNKKLTMEYANGSMCPNGRDRKSTLLNFVCDKEISSEAQIFYVGSLHDCSYFFEVRSVYACPTSNKTNEVNVLGIFVGIFAVFFIVEFAGRRWLYEKVKDHFDAKNSAIPGVSAVRPRWEFVEREPRWKTALKSVDRLAQGIFGAATSLIYKLTNTTATAGTRGTIRLNSSAVPSSASQESFTRDMERQNNIIDSLEVVSRDSSTSLEERRA